jgi:hypothetical protein
MLHEPATFYSQRIKTEARQIVDGAFFEVFQAIGPSLACERVRAAENMHLACHRLATFAIRTGMRSALQLLHFSLLPDRASAKKPDKIDSEGYRRA